MHLPIRYVPQRAIIAEDIQKKTFAALRYIDFTDIPPCLGPDFFPDEGVAALKPPTQCITLQRGWVIGGSSPLCREV